MSPIENNDKSCLDHFWRNFVDITSESFVINPNISDHYAFMCLLDQPITMKTTEIQFRDYSMINTENFRNNISNEFRNYNQTSADINEQADYLTKFLRD